MPVTKHNPEELFKDATELQRQAIKELEAGNIRDAAEKAWGATVRATSGLVLARTGEQPGTTTQIRIAIEQQADKDSALDSLRLRYLSRETSLHGGCFYDGICEPRQTIERRIRETDQFIEDARKLAGNSQK